MVKSSDASSHGFRTFREDFCTSLFHHPLLIFTPLVQNKLRTCLLTFSVINMLPRIEGREGRKGKLQAVPWDQNLGIFMAGKDLD